MTDVDLVLVTVAAPCALGGDLGLACDGEAGLSREASQLTPLV